jgi:hypothetical protein
MKFEKLHQYIEQNQKGEQLTQEMIKREQDALNLYQAKKAEYEALITSSVIGGQDKTAELDSLDEEIKQANAAYLRRKKEREVLSLTRPWAEISSEDVVASFNNELVPQFRQERFDQVLKNLLKAKFAYVQAVEDYHAAVKEFNGIRAEAREELSDTFYYKLKDIELQTNAEVEKYFLTNTDLFDLNVNTFPRSLKYVKPEEME